MRLKLLPLLLIAIMLMPNVYAQRVGPGTWTWLKGTNTTNKLGTFTSSPLVADTGNNPGCRESGMSWMDKAGNFWLFGGRGYAKKGTIAGFLNDLWKYDPATNGWMWMHGDTVTNPTTTFGVKGTPAAANTPGSRYRSTTWTDRNGNLYLFGGTGMPATKQWNDVWKFDIALNQWTWISGANTLAPNMPTTVSTAKGTPATFNVIGSREGASSWVDTAGNFWIWGGYGFANAGKTLVYLNDLWKYNPATDEWTWMHGDTSANVLGVYGTKGVSAPTNKPGARRYATSWVDTNGKFWLFGGEFAPTTTKRFNDLWKYDPVTNEWTWVNGSDTTNGIGTYGNRYIAEAGIMPGARSGAEAYVGPGNYIWLYAGSGYTKNPAATGYTNELWLYNMVKNQWALVNGDSIDNAVSVYGTIRVPDSLNNPGGRYQTHGGWFKWNGFSGSIWTFGGHGKGTATSFGHLNDMWRLDLCFKVDTLSAIMGDDSVCANTVHTYSVPNANDATGYEWILPSGWTGSSTTNSITVTVGSNPVGTIGVRGVNSCDTGDIRTLDVHVPLFPPVLITVNGFTLGTGSKYKNYQWYKDGKLVQSATDSTYAVVTNGVYSVKVMNEIGCTDSASYTVTNVGVRNVNSNNVAVKIYPNPARDYIYINAAIPVDAHIMSIDGKVVLQQENVTRIATGNLTEGLYIIKVTDHNGQLLHIEKVLRVK